MPIGQHLETVARASKCITYQDLINAFPTLLPPLDGAWPAHPLSRIFEALDQDDAQNNRPFRTSVVINQMTNQPGGGYFEALQRIKGITCLNDIARTTAWIKELNDAYAHPWP
jgi:hypothetical protein